MESEERFDFNTVPDYPIDYLKTYYVKVNIDEVYVADFMLKHFQNLEPGQRAIELGCGPTLHHASLLARYVPSIDMAEYQLGNLAAVRAWKEGWPDAHNWNPYTEMILEKSGVEATNENVAEHERVLKNTLRHLVKCDASTSPPTFSSCDENPTPSIPKQYPIVTTYYMAEQIGRTKEDWEAVMKNISMMVAPGGRLFLSAVRDATWYEVDGEQIPCTPITKEMMIDCLKKLGFKPKSIEVESHDTPEIEEHGLPGILVATAQMPEEIKESQALTTDFSGRMNHAINPQ